MKKIAKYFFVFVCFITLLTLGEGCKSGNFSSSIDDGFTGQGVPGGPGSGGTGDPGGTTTGTVASDSFEVTQSTTDPEVDILIVIDTSGSMDHHQQKLAQRFGDLAAGLSNTNLPVDWQMAFTSTDDSDPEVDADGYHGSFYNLEDEDGEIEVDGENVSILTADISDDSDYLQKIFLNTINRSGKSVREEGEDSGIEVPLRNITNAIAKRNSDNSGFFRDSATLVTIILSNEDELSDGLAKDGIEPTSAEDVRQSVSDAFGDDKRFVSYGIIIKPEDTDCRDAEIRRSGRTSATFGTFVHELSVKTYSICENDYSGILLDIGSHLEASLTLSSIPLRYGNVIASSVTLTFTPAENEQSGSFDAASNTYRFDEKPANGTTIRIEYQYYESQ